MTTAPLAWRPSRTRVLVRGLDNPWARDGSIGRDHRAFCRALTGADRQEEDEDFEVLAPPRPTRSWRPVADDRGDWFDAELADQLADGSIIHEPEPEPRVTSAATRAEREARREALIEAKQRKRERTVERAILEAKPWRATLANEYNRRLLEALEEHLERTPDGHVYNLHWLNRLTLVDTRGFKRSLVIRQAVLVLERGDVERDTRMVRVCGAQHCVATDHHDVE